jgi:predicted regulator of Ras-like GTPase activity (Roadblock/LC7/MglB family)
MSDPGEALIEAPRDMEESGFTPILRALMHSVPGLLAVVFVDADGECVDYCSALPPFDAKVIAAHMLVVAADVRRRTRAQSGEPWSVHVHGSARDVLVRRISDDYALVVVARSTGRTSLLHESVELAVRELRIEGGVKAPPWEPSPERIHVEVRRSIAGWSYAPRAYWYHGDRIAITDVLGRWTEVAPASGGGDPPRRLVCFLVRTETGRELTLIHDAERDAWNRR